MLISQIQNNIFACNKNISSFKSIAQQCSNANSKIGVYSNSPLPVPICLYSPKSENIKRGQLLSTRGEIINRHNSKYCRTDLNWSMLEKIIKKKYTNPENVNFIVYACSYGQEPYSLAILLNKIYGHPVKISASDISEDVISDNIKKQNEGVFIENSDLTRICESLKIENYENFVAHKDGKVQIRREITDSVNFKCSNILDDITSIDNSKPTVLFARNMWPYVNYREYDGFCHKLYNSLSSNSLFIIGSYDYEGERGCIKSDSFPKQLLINGFKSIDGNILSIFKYFNLIFAKK